MKKYFYLPHLTALVLFILLPLVYFSPMLEGKKLEQGDTKNWAGAAKEVNNYKSETGKVSFWTNSMFGGMPTYLINNPVTPNIFQKIYSVLNSPKVRPACHLFLYMLGFYLALLAFGVNPWLSMAGAFAYGFSSYFFIIIAAGHMTKAVALGYLPPIIAGIHLAYNRKILAGAFLMAVFLTFQLVTNHLQITYYTLMIAVVVAVVELIYAVLQKQIFHFVKVSAALLAGGILALASNATSLYLVYDYGKDSMRGKTELTSDKENRTGGLDRDYATSWSYGKAETFTLFIPNFVGGESGGPLSTKSETYNLISQQYGKPQAKKMIQQMPTYWGPQPFTSGPVYVGAIVFFLFVLGLFVIKGKLRWWILAATLLSVFLAWGRNFMPFTNFFLDYIPGYNKFRTVSMILIIAEFTIPLLAILAVQKIIQNELEQKQFKKYFIWALGIVGGLALIFSLFGGAFFSFSSAADSEYPQPLVDALMADRQSLLQMDAFRSLILILLGATALWMVYFKKISLKWFYVSLMVLLLVDLWPINKRYLNDGQFKPSRKVSEYFTATKANEFILKDKDPDFRVLNLSVSTFNDASTSYFHKSVGGYHGAKMKRYQELIDHHISREMQQLIGAFNSKAGGDSVLRTMALLKVINMLNTKYIIYNPEASPLINLNALGNAWFVDTYRLVKDADSEILSMSTFDPTHEAVVDKRFQSLLENFKFVANPNAAIHLIDYKPDYLKYKFRSNTDQFTVFSEIYYDKGWQAYIDDKPVPHFRVNYVLRAMTIPAGEHTIEFKFVPKAIKWTNPVSFASSLLLLLAALGVLVLEIKRKEDNISA